MGMAEADELLGVESNFGQRDCSDEGHLLGATIAHRLYRNVPSKNGPILFCDSCGKKLPKVDQ